MENLDRYGSLELQDTNEKKLALIVGFKEKVEGAKNGYINSGSYFMDPMIFYAYPNKKFSLENDILTPMSVKKEIYAVKSEESEFLDIGIPSDFYAAQTLLPIWSP